MGFYLNGLSSAVVLGGILDWTQVMLQDVDLNHQSGSCFQHHVNGLGVTDLGQ